jgi:hypothetical protein
MVEPPLPSTPLLRQGQQGQQGQQLVSRLFSSLQYSNTHASRVINYVDVVAWAKTEVGADESAWHYSNASGCTVSVHSMTQFAQRTLSNEHSNDSVNLRGKQ